MKPAKRGSRTRGQKSEQRRSVARVARRERRQGKSMRLVSFYSAYHEKLQPFIKQCNRRLASEKVDSDSESKKERQRKDHRSRRWPVSLRRRTTLNTEHGDRTKCPSLKWPPETLPLFSPSPPAIFSSAQSARHRAYVRARTRI